MFGSPSVGRPCVFEKGKRLVEAGRRNMMYGQVFMSKLCSTRSLCVFFVFRGMSQLPVFTEDACSFLGLRELVQSEQQCRSLPAFRHHQMVDWIPHGLRFSHMGK